jgi:streptomycin 6-kinase
VKRQNEDMAWTVPVMLAANCRKVAERMAWLERLPNALRNLEHRWSLTLGAPFEEASCAWVAPAVLATGSSAVLKLGMPQHMEGEHELQGLRFWSGRRVSSTLIHLAWEFSDFLPLSFGRLAPAC